MSTSSKSDSDDSIFEMEELLVIEARCRELRREKDLLNETQSQSFDLIKKLELHVRRLNEARTDDKKQIQDLERELSNCHQETDYLQDQLKSRDSEMECLEDEILSLREELKKSNSQCEFLMQELETRESELLNSSFHIANLEESISSAFLEYQCEIESMRLEMMTLEPKSKLLHELQLQIYNAQKTIEQMENENKQVKDKDKVKDDEYEQVVKRLKEQLREEKLKAKDEAEELAQEMAELRYQMTELLEEEKKRRVYIEQVSLQRISELEAQLRIEQRKSVGNVQYICET